MSAKCSGDCLRASDVGVGVAGNPVAYAHPDCPEHGDGEGAAVAAIARRLGVTFGGVPEIVCALDSLEGRAAIAEGHAKALTLALRNVRALAKKTAKVNPETSKHLLRFCDEAGVTDSILRGGA